MGDPERNRPYDPQRSAWLWTRSGQQARTGAAQVRDVAVAVAQAVADGRLTPLADAGAMTQACDEMQQLAGQPGGASDELREAARTAARAIVAVVRGPDRVPHTGAELSPALEEIRRELTDDTEPKS